MQVRDPIFQQLFRAILEAVDERISKALAKVGVVGNKIDGSFIRGAMSGAVMAHADLTGLVSPADDHTQYLKLLAPRTATATDYTILSTDYYVGVTDTAAPRTMTLPAVVEGQVVIVKDESGGAATNNITVATPGAETIDGVSTAVITTNYGAIRFFSDGTNWFIL